MNASREPLASIWCGVERYACPMCDFDALQSDRVVAHISEAHPLPSKPEPDPVIVEPSNGLQPEPVKKGK